MSVLASVINLVRIIKQYVADDTRCCRLCKGFHDTLCSYLQDYEGRLNLALETGDWKSQSESIWGSVSIKREGDSRLSLLINGPAVSDQFSLTASNESEAGKIVSEPPSPSAS